VQGLVTVAMKTSDQAFAALRGLFNIMVTQPQTVKAAMNLRGWNGGSVRRPLIDLDEAQRTALEGIVRPLVRTVRDLHDADAGGRASERAT
jgi:dihydrodipicolinate synthase/N-acetylneuraminate lyase